jgi:hypothetical protein
MNHCNYRVYLGRESYGSRILPSKIEEIGVKNLNSKVQPLEHQF